jgi:hypothetical protein
MKTFAILLLCVTVLLLFSATAHAQSNYPKQEIGVGIGLVPINQLGCDIDDNDVTEYPKYYTTDKKNTPSAFIQYMYHLKKWIAIGSYLGYNHSSQDKKYTQTHEIFSKYHDNRFFILPTVRFTFYHSAIVRLYGEVSTGIAIYNKKDFDEKKYKIGCDQAIQMNFFGISVGKNLYGFTTVGIGELGLLNGGIGYRF